MKAEGSVKQEHILEAAIRRFSHFGLQKTTLAEIAEDLSISKPLLFYYFQDKQSLIAAVASKIITEFLTASEVVLTSAESVEKGLTEFVAVKKEHLKKYFLLALQGDSVDLQKVPGEIQALYQQAQSRMVSLISKLLQEGIDQEFIRPVDTEKTSRLLLETLAAFEYCIKRKNPIPGSADIDQVFDKQVEVLQMFLTGLKRA